MQQINTSEDVKNQHEDIDLRIQNAWEPSEIKSLMDGLPGHSLIKVLGKFQVTPMLYAYTAHHLAGVCDLLIPDVQYSVRELVGDECWAEGEGSHGWRRELELCLKHFAQNPDSPINDLKNGYFGCK